MNNVELEKIIQNLNIAIEQQKGSIAEQWETFVKTGLPDDVPENALIMVSTFFWNQIDDSVKAELSTKLFECKFLQDNQYVVMNPNIFASVGING